MFQRFLFFCISIFYCQHLIQAQHLHQARGSRFVLDLPEEFRPDPNFMGFLSKVDSSAIFVYEVVNPYEFEELVYKQISNILKSGTDTSDFEKGFYEGYPSFQYFIYPPATKEKVFVCVFGNSKFLLRIEVECPKERMEELKQLVLTKGSYIDSLIIDYDKLLGFSVSYDSSGHSIKKKDANSINSVEISRAEITDAYLNLSRMPLNYFSGLTDLESVRYMKRQYFPQAKLKDKGISNIGPDDFFWEVYETDRDWYKEYNIIGIIRKKEFDLLAVGGANTEERLLKIFGIIETLKFND